MPTGRGRARRAGQGG